MKYALVDNSNIVQNIIAYDGIKLYAPPDGLSLQQINNWVNIGDDKDKPEQEE